MYASPFNTKDFADVSRLINPLSTEYEVAHCLNISQPKAIAADASTWPTLSAAASRQGFSELRGIAIDDKQCPMQTVRDTLSSLKLDKFSNGILVDLVIYTIRSKGLPTRI